MTFTPATIKSAVRLTDAKGWRIPTTNTRPESGVRSFDKKEHPIVAWYDPSIGAYELYLRDEGGYRYFRVI